MNETRRALIVANSDYQDGSFRGLVSPAHDAEQLARVLRDPSIGGFEVAALLNEKAAAVNQAIEEFFIFSDPKPDDLLLLYFSGHGITDEEGHLYLATADTQLVRQSVRRASAVAAEFVDSTMRRSRSRRQVLLLDCCHSGAFAEEMRVKGEALPSLDTHFKGIQGRGRIVLTASTGRQFSFEGSSDKGDEPSAYTRVLVRGLETGEADLHNDGQVDLDELHEYLLQQLHSVAPYQTPTKSGYLEGQLYIARAKLVRPAEIPQKLQHALNASEAWMRQGALTELEALSRAEHRGLALAAELRLVYIRDNDDSLKVRAAAAKCLADLAEQDRIARDEADAERQRRENAAPEEKAKAEAARRRAEAAKRKAEEEQARAEKAVEEAEAARPRAEADKRKAEAEHEPKVDAAVREANEAMAKAASEQKGKTEAAWKREDVRDWIILATLFIVGNVLAGLVGRWHEAAVEKYFTIDWPLFVRMAITSAVIGVFLGMFSDDDGSLWLTTALTTWPGYLIGFKFFPSDPAQEQLSIWLGIGCAITFLLFTVLGHFVLKRKT